MKIKKNPIQPLDFYLSLTQTSLKNVYKKKLGPSVEKNLYQPNIYLLEFLIAQCYQRLIYPSKFIAGGKNYTVFIYVLFNYLFINNFT